MLIFFFRGMTQNIDITFQDAIESFYQYEIAINDFLEYPAEEKIPEVNQYGEEFAYFSVSKIKLYNR